MGVKAADQLFSNPELNSSVMNSWERFMAGVDPEAVGRLRGIIGQSWRRCQSAELDHRRDQAPPPLPEDDLHLLRDERRELIAASAPMMGLARDFLHETGTVMVLTDARGLVLNVEGDGAAVLRDATERVHLLPGADWSEDACGTNAIGTALLTGQPAQVHSAEHFCSGMKAWSCSANVILDPVDGAILGAIDISGLQHSYSRHTMALAAATAKRIENQIAQIEAELRFRLIERCLWEAPKVEGSHVVIFDRYGRPVKSSADLAVVERDLKGAGAGRAPPPGFERLPAWARPEWLKPIQERGERLGAILIAPRPSLTLRRGRRPEEAAAIAAALARSARPAAEEEQAFTDLVAEAPAMRRTLERARRVAPSSAPVLLLGETGVGKEVFARNLHAASRVAEGPFVALNCGGLTRELLTSELFGYAEGAFTGARKGGMMGKIEAAHGGTLFLDEIGEMPLDLQPLLLRSLEEREICRIGETKPRRVDFRLVAATNRDLRAAIEGGGFRRDLYHRISVVNVEIPPLRERLCELPSLVRRFNLDAAERHEAAPREFPPEILEKLQAYAWPGNLRELRNLVESLVLTAPEVLILDEDLPPEIREAGRRGRSRAPCAASDGLSGMEAAEREAILRSLRESGGNVAAAANALGLAKSTVYAKLKRYRLDPRAAA